MRRTNVASNADLMYYSRIGGATLKMPPSNFSQTGLARLFGFDLDENIQAPSNPAHRRTVIIAGTVCGVVGLAILVALGAYAACWLRKKHAHLEEPPVFEKDVYSDVHGRVVELVELPPRSTDERAKPDGPS